VIIEKDKSYPSDPILGTKHAMEQKFRNENNQLHTEVEEYQQGDKLLYHLKQAVEMMQLGVIITNLEGKIIYANPAVAEMHGYQVSELIERDEKLLIPPAYQKPPTLPQLQRWKGLVREGFNLKKDGTCFPVWLMSEIVQNDEGDPWAIVTSYEDITERKQAAEELERHRDYLEEIVKVRTLELTLANTQLQNEIIEHKRTAEALQKSEERYRIVLEAAPDPVVVYDIEKRVTYLNPAFSRIFGWTLDETRGHDLDFVPVEHLSENLLIFTKISHGEIISGIETSRLTREGNRVQVGISGAGFFDAQGKLQGSVITIQDITERKKTEEEIRFIAYHDILTGLQNRKSFYIRLENKLAHLSGQVSEKRHKGEKWAILFLDLDKFKYINDTLGHDVGDELLKLVAGRLQGCLRKSDHVFRLGGDEFTILLSDISNDTDIAKVAEKIRVEIAQPYFIKNQEIYITVSIGVSIYPDDGQGVETLVKNADMAMYAAKEENEGYRFFTEEMNQRILERMKLESSLRIALQQNQFVIHYQPLVNEANQIVGMEALLRWCHPNLGLINPSQFIPLAEETGAIVPIGKWVLHTACQQTKKWYDMGYTALYVSVNLSTRQFKEPDLIETVEQILEATGILPVCLNLEITESSIMENPEEAIATITHLRAKGIHFSIDDFGTGYSSLVYLKRFPIDALKIDRSFVLDSGVNKGDQEIIKMIISMAQNLNMETVAEGVETKEQMDFLINHGCHTLQGFYLGWPVPADKFEEMLQTKRLSNEGTV
jgi:diguanylate cyclase (GGDEF)-like protein/PAS domain S-box-containing protein